MLTIARITTPEQAAQMVPLVQQMSDASGYGFAIEAQAWPTEKYISSPVLDVIGAWWNGEAVGVTFLGRVGMGYTQADDGYFHGLYVQPQHRGTGAAQGLFVALNNLAKERGYRNIMWLVHVGNAASHAFFNKHGVNVTDDYTVYYHAVDDLPK
jgi:GNAT superfamily N-acetyltransferase